MHCTIQGMCERNKINIIIIMPVLATNLLIRWNYNIIKMCTQHNYYICLFIELAMVLTIYSCTIICICKYSDFSCILDLMKYKQCV